MASAALLVCPELGLSREQREELHVQNRQKTVLAKKSATHKSTSAPSKPVFTAGTPTTSIFLRASRFFTEVKALFITSTQEKPTSNIVVNDETGLIMKKNMASTMVAQNFESSYLQKLPIELLEEIFTYLDGDSIKNLRETSKKCKKVVDGSMRILKKFDIFEVDRLIIRYLPEKKVYELRWCIYASKTTRKLYVSQNDLKSPSLYFFAFRQMSFKRIMFKGLHNKTLSNDFMRFLCDHFEFCLKFELTQLSFENVDFSSLCPNQLGRLLGLRGKTLETFQVNNVYGLSRNSINDTHIKQLDPSKIKRLTLQSIKFGGNLGPKKKLLKITDESIKWLMSAGQFPTLIFEHCQITTPIMCRYIEKWLQKATQDTVNSAAIKSHSFQLKHCPSVSSEIFEKECIVRKISYSKASTPENTYTLFTDNASTEFEVLLG